MNNDLISRSALLEEFEWLKANTGTYNHAELDEHIQRINNTSAVDTEVVRHGRWISENIRKKSYLRQCSVCNKIAYFCGTGCSYNYCPNCGAKMDGEHNDIQRV